MEYFQVQALKYLTGPVGGVEVPPGRINSEWKKWLRYYSFPQTWGSTALGFGGMGGSAMTTSQIHIIVSAGLGKQKAIVFYNRKAAFMCNYGPEFQKALDTNHVPSIKEAKEKYNNVVSLN